MKQYVTLDKRSKKAQREYYAKQRTTCLVPFANKFPKNTKLYKLMTTKPGEGA